MQERPGPLPPRLEAMLHERDLLRIEINLASEHGETDVAELRRRLLLLERDIVKFWGSPD